MTTASSAAPVSGRERIHSLDVVRGFALFGILLMNIIAFSMPVNAYSDPTVWGGATGANLWTWITTDMLFEGTQRALFSLLFGAGFIVLTSRLEAKGRDDVADIYYRRSLWLVIFGVIHGYVLLWFGEVLFWYGMTALMLFPLRKLSPKAMLGLAALALVANALWNLGELQASLNSWEKAQAAQVVLDGGGKLTEDQQAAVDDWKGRVEEIKSNERELRRDVEAHQGSYLDVLKFLAPHTAAMESAIYHRVFFDVFSMMMLGMALFKLGVLTLKLPSRTYWAMVLIGYPIGLAINYYELQIILAGHFSALARIQSHWTYDFGRLAMTMGHLGLMLLFCRSGVLQWLQRRLAAVGQMALTSYVSHSLICALVFYGFGFGLYGQLERHQVYYVWGAICVFQLIVSPIWLKHFRFGPLEWVWRSLTYLERQPMRRGSAGEVAVPV